MSTTVTYKGSTLTTAENQTRVLQTSGKYMEGDITITDVTSGGDWQTMNISGDFASSMTAYNSTIGFAFMYIADPTTRWISIILNDFPYADYTVDVDYSIDVSSGEDIQAYTSTYYDYAAIYVDNYKGSAFTMGISVSPK